MQLGEQQRILWYCVICKKVGSVPITKSLDPRVAVEALNKSHESVAHDCAAQNVDLVPSWILGGILWEVLFSGEQFFGRPSEPSARFTL